MRSTHALSAEQLLALEPQIRLIEAGPGAGKTLTVVSRFRQQTRNARGVALLSFTNAAVNVARSRCLDAPGLLEAPNFVGTFDQFFHRYVVTPATVRTSGKAPTYLTSWDDLSDRLAIVRPQDGGVGLRLSRLTTTANAEVVFDQSRFNRNEARMWEKITPWTRKQLTAKATQRVASLRSAHVHDTMSARESALSVLGDPHGIFAARLAHRFEELIVDEFQDCDEVEHQLLDTLQAAGIRVVAAADPDQAIYEFRQTSPDLYRQFRDRLAPDEIAHLSTCYRSTPTICALVTSLRSVGQGVISPTESAQPGPDIHVVVGTGVKAGKVAFELVRQHGVAGGRTRVIAHRRSDARSLTRPGKEPPQGASFMERILTAVAELRSGLDARGRLAAVSKLERAVLDLVEWPADAKPTTRAQQLDLLGITSDQMRILVSKIKVCSEDWTDSKACSTSLRTLIEATEPMIALDLVANLGRKLVIPEKVWSFWASRTQGALLEIDGEIIKWGHVHGVKGDEFEAVIVALPSKAFGKSHVLDDWEGDLNSEQRRVLYVAVSRAERVLILVVPPGRRKQLEAVLTSAGLAYGLRVTA